MKDLKVYEKVKEKLVMAENVAQAAQFVDSGNADVGLVAGSIVPPQKSAAMALAPEEFAPKVEQHGVVLQRSKEKAAARSFLAFLTTEEARQVLQRSGFRVPERKGR